MAVSQVASATAGIQQQFVQTQKAQEVERPRENTEARRTNEAQVMERRASEQAQRSARTEQPRPVVNAQGQKTGTIVNTTA